MSISIHEKPVQIGRVPDWKLKQPKVLSERTEYALVEAKSLLRRPQSLLGLHC